MKKQKAKQTKENCEVMIFSRVICSSIIFFAVVMEMNPFYQIFHYLVDDI